MFTVKLLGQNTPNNIPIHSGITFGFVDKEHIFELTLDQVDKPLKILFIVKRDKSKGLFEFSMDQIVDNTLSVYFFNPPKAGCSGLACPTRLLKVKNNILGFMFHLEFLSNSNCYRMAYEFYHGRTSEKEVE